jgi:hypothetical protein
VGIAVVVGNPKPQSRTLEAALHVATELAGVASAVVVDVVELGPGLLGWGDPAVASALDAGDQSDDYLSDDYLSDSYLSDKAYTDPAALDPWLAVARRFVPAGAALGAASVPAEGALA